MNISNPQISQIPALRALWKEAFGDTDEFLDIFFKKVFHPSRCLCISGGEQVTAVLYWFNCLHEGKPIAYIYAVATAKSHRGQGLCRQLLDDTHRHLAALGYEGALLVPGSAALFEMYGKMGYVTCTSIREFQCTAKPEELQLLEIDQFEYAKLRKMLLPKGSVVQENENLDFLQTYAHFYIGHGFLLAAFGEKDTLLGIELLGDITAAPAITYSLGYKKGSFRTTGNGRPFAMYHSLGDSTLSSPSYFGFAFD